MEIGSNQEYPGNKLSNFARHPFIFRGFEIASMEGFLQGLKFEKPHIQAEVFKLGGRSAKARGSNKNWQQSQTLYWQGTPIKRTSQAYQELLDEAYEALFTQNESARNALLASRNATLEHSIGKKRMSETVLTRTEFTRKLTDIRTKLQKKTSK